MRKIMPSATNIWFAFTIFVVAADTSLWLYGSPLAVHLQIPQHIPM